MKLSSKKKLYVLLAVLLLIGCGVVLYVIFGGNGKDTSDNGSKPSQSEEKYNEDSETDKSATKKKDNEQKSDEKKSDEKKSGIEEPGEVIVRPSQETGATGNTETPEVNEPQPGNPETPKEDEPQPGNPETPESSNVIELPFVPIP